MSGPQPKEFSGPAHGPHNLWPFAFTASISQNALVNIENFKSIKYGFPRTLKVCYATSSCKHILDKILIGTYSIMSLDRATG